MSSEHILQMVSRKLNYCTGNLQNRDKHRIQNKLHSRYRHLAFFFGGGRKLNCAEYLWYTKMRGRQGWSHIPAGWAQHLDWLIQYLSQPLVLLTHRSNRGSTVFFSVFPQLNYLKTLRKEAQIDSTYQLFWLSCKNYIRHRDVIKKKCGLFFNKH